jgi:hypothetical protein
MRSDRGFEVLAAVVMNSSIIWDIQGVTERRGQILGTSSMYQNNRKSIHIYMCPEIFNL